MESIQKKNSAFTISTTEFGQPKESLVFKAIDEKNDKYTQSSLTTVQRLPLTTFPITMALNIIEITITNTMGNLYFFGNKKTI